MWHQTSQPNANKGNQLVASYVAKIIQLTC